MSATHSEHNPSMRRYFREAGLSREELAKRCGVSHSRIYVARTQSVRSNNVEKISDGMTHILDLSGQERLELKAEIMEHPGDRVLAYFGPRGSVMRRLGVSESTVLELMDGEIL